MKSEVIITDLIFFFIVAAIFLTILAVSFRIFCKHFKFNDKNVEIYGLLLDLDSSSLISIATITINYLFLVWWMISFNGANIIYIAITLVLVLISEAIIDNFKGLPISMFLSLLNCLGIHIVYLIYDYVTNESLSYLLMVVLCLVIVFIFLYFTYNLFRQINNIVIRNKYLKNKKYNI